MKSSRVVIKLGGAALKDSKVLDIVTEAVKQYRKYDYQVVLVHGGGPAINNELTVRGITWNFVDGQRVTSPEMMDIIEATLNGRVRSQVVRALVREKIPAIGFSGTDGLTLQCSPASVALGRVGHIDAVNARLLESVLALPEAPVPVISPIGVGLDGSAFNINADWAASHLAVALKAQYLIFLTDQAGILDQGMQLIPAMCPDELQGLIDNDIVKDGMRTKTRAVLHALEGGVQAVRVMNGRDSIVGLWSNFIGTWCSPKDEQPVVTSEYGEVQYDHA